MNIGDRVTVTDGPYAGQSGTLTDLAGIRAGVLIDSLGKRRSILCEDLIPAAAQAELV
jgi:ribosomal protein L24